MSDIRTTFVYDPIRQGYDTNSWRTISGSPAVVNGRIAVDNQAGLPGSAVHYADFLKGDISISVNVPAAPSAGGAVRYVGVSSPNTGSYIRFAFDSSLTCQTSNGSSTTTSSAITWESAWTGANITLGVRWEAGTAKFFINGSQVYAVSDASVPHGPLSLYLYDSADTSMTVGDMIVRGTQSFVMQPKTSDSASTVVTGTLNRSESVTVTENVSLVRV